MLHQVARMLGFSKQRQQRSQRMAAEARRRHFFAENRRHARVERLEAREVMDATLHNIAAANIQVVQNDELNNASSVTITPP